MKKRIAILGSTGSIGTNALDVLSKMPKDFEITALACGSNVNLLARQTALFRPKVVCVADGELAAKTKKLIRPPTKIMYGIDGLKAIASSRDIDMVLMAISTTACLIPLVEAIKSKKLIALANKEAIVSAGPIIMDLAKKTGARIIPVDSEHSAIFQCLDARRDCPSKIYLTGSGGPLLNISAKKFDSIKKRDILKHPKWKMGEKITIDSATMMNKGLEILEAQYLFAIGENRIEVLVHPEAIIHSMVEFSDGAVLAQMALPDMRLPIQYAFTYPSRGRACIKSVDFLKLKKLSFEKPDNKKFPCLELARECARQGGTSPAVLCAADEEVVCKFLSGFIKFSDIPKVIEKVLSRHKNTKRTALSIGDILAAGQWAREEARSICCH
jgi:1-deoxy-D-xylulose-5-phosphate reductoisomerase